MTPYTFIGLADKEEILKTIGNKSWETTLYDVIPLSAVNPAPGYLFTLGSGNISLATTSIYNLTYNAGIDVFRTDFGSRNPNEPLINIDHYVAGAISPNQFAIYKTPPEPYHWPTIYSPIITEIPDQWQAFVKSVLKRDRS
jgi:hypothetical protein